MLNFNRRSLALTGVAMALAGTMAVANAQTYPVRPIQLIVPAATGGSTDLFTRKFAQHVQKHLGTTVVVQNKGGGGGSIATGEVGRAAPDGYTLLMGTTGNMVINPLTMTLNFDPMKQLTPIATVGFVAFSINTHPGLKVDSVGEFVKLVKAAPGKYSYATNGPAGFIHLITELFSKQAGLEMVAVPYPGGSAMQQDLISGRIHVYFDAFNSALRFHRSGQTKLLATTGAKRSPSAPEIPTVAEDGMPGYVAETAFILLAPTGTPQPAIDHLLSATRKTLADAGFRAELDKLGVRPVMDSNPRATSDYLQAEYAKWTPFVKSLKAQR